MPNDLGSSSAWTKSLSGRFRLIGEISSGAASIAMRRETGAQGHLVATRSVIAEIAGEPAFLVIEVIPESGLKNPDFVSGFLVDGETSRGTASVLRRLVPPSRKPRLIPGEL